jgi:Tc5 transposase DNA-binding domain/helix-turn-helix, Psq domain
MERESRIRKALRAIGKPETPTVAAAARKFGIVTSTLYNRYRKATSTHQAAHEHQMVLTMAQEQAVVSWIAGLTATGFPPSKALLKSRIEDLKETFKPGSPPLGVNYITTFISRHPELGYAYADRRDKNRAIKGVQHVYEEFFDKVTAYFSR